MTPEDVIEDGIPRSLAGAKKLDFFVLRQVQAGGVRQSLHAYENGIIRKLGDERLHLALNCMVVASPRLPRAPFRAETLNADLHREARRFFSATRNLEVDASRRTVRMSEILSFYSADFRESANPGNLVLGQRDADLL